MQQTIQALTVFAPLAWVLAAALYGLSFAGESSASAARLRGPAWLGAFAVHLALFAVRWVDAHQFPVTETWSALSATALLVALFYAGIAVHSGHTGSAPFALGLVAALQLASSAWGPLDARSNVAEPGALYVLHVTTSLGAAAALVLSGLHGWLYLWLYRQMKHRRLGASVKGLPDLGQLALLTRRAALAGFVFLTVAVNLGIGWAHARGTPGFSYTDPWVLVMIVLWLHFGVVAFSSLIPGLTARRASWAATAGLLIFLASLVLMQLPRVSFHWQA